MAGKQSPKIGARTRRSVGQILDDVERNVALGREVAADRDIVVQTALKDLETAVKACRQRLSEAGEA